MLYTKSIAAIKLKYAIRLYTAEILHPCLKKTSHLWLAITLTHVNGFWYFLAEMLPIKWAVKRHFTVPHQLTRASALRGKWRNAKIAFFPQCCLSALPEFNQRLDFFNLFDSRLILTLLSNSLSLVISAIRSIGGMIQEKESRQHCSSWTVLHAQCTSALSSGFLISHGNAEALHMWGGISYFLSNTSAKNYHNWIVCVKIIASQRWDVFLRHGVIDKMWLLESEGVHMWSPNCSF